jgi:hypothetical protein
MYWALALGLGAPSVQKRTSKGARHDHLSFHRRLERKWTRRIDHIPTITGNATPPRDPNDDEDEDEEDEEEERQDEPAIVREPDCLGMCPKHWREYRCHPDPPR